MSKIIDSVRLPYNVTVAATGTGTISSDRVKTGQMLVCQSIAFRNQTGARGTATLRIKQSGVNFPLGDHLSPAANTWYYYPYEQYVNEGEQVEVSQASCYASDVLDLVIIGYVEYKAEVKAR
jgi:hypothetical protein